MATEKVATPSQLSSLSAAAAMSQALAENKSENNV